MSAAKETVAVVRPRRKFFLRERSTVKCALYEAVGKIMMGSRLHR